MKNLLHEENQPEQLAAIIAVPIALAISLLFYFIKIVTKLIVKLKRFLYKTSLFLFVVYGLYSFFGQVAHAPEADASQPHIDHVTVSLPMKVHPDLKVREIVLSLVRIEFGEDQVEAFDDLVTHESGWDPQAVNESSGACGLFQSLPCNKMGSMALEDQIKFGFTYIKNRYGTPKKAWAFWQNQSPHWY